MGMTVLVAFALLAGAVTAVTPCVLPVLPALLSASGTGGRRRPVGYLKQLDDRYRDSGLVIVGLHTPEFSFEKDAGNVGDAIRQSGLRYPIVQDNDFATWSAFGNQYWPAKYLIDAEGQVRYTHFGEGAYHETEEAVRMLLAEAGRRAPASRGGLGAETAAPGVQTPETYLGARRAARFLPGPPRPGRHRYAPVPERDLPPSHFTLAGTWAVDDESATAVRGARISGLVMARRVFLVLTSRGRTPRRVTVRVDGRRTRRLTVTRQRLYALVSLPQVREFRLRLDLAPGISGYAFTFE
jgi:hypothetical protein